MMDKARFTITDSISLFWSILWPIFVVFFVTLIFINFLLVGLGADIKTSEKIGSLYGRFFYFMSWFIFPFALQRALNAKAWIHKRAVKIVIVEEDVDRAA